jgi:hypothetical protein
VLRGGDVELLALIAEYQRLRDKANQGEMSEEERARRCDDFRSVRDKIEKLRRRPCACVGGARPRDGRGPGMVA